MSPRARAHLARERNAEAEEDDGDGASGEGARERSCARSVSPAHAASTPQSRPCHSYKICSSFLKIITMRMPKDLLLPVK